MDAKMKLEVKDIRKLMEWIDSLGVGPTIEVEIRVSHASGIGPAVEAKIEIESGQGVWKDLTDYSNW
jgi:hypothetical protein